MAKKKKTRKQKIKSHARKSNSMSSDIHPVEEIITAVTSSESPEPSESETEDSAIVTAPYALIIDDIRRSIFVSLAIFASFTLLYFLL